MKKWLEDNWLNKIDKLFEKGNLRVLPLDNPDDESDGNNYEKLDIDNLTDFPKLMNFLFIDADLGKFLSFDGYPSSRLESLVAVIGYRDDEKGECKRRADIFKSFLIDTFINLYKSKILDPAEQRWQEIAKPEDRENLAKKDYFFKMRLGKTAEETYQEFDNMRPRAESLELNKLSKDARSVDVYTRSVLFDVRPDFIAINTTSNFIRNAFKEFKKDKEFATRLKKNFQCSSFRTGITAIKGGKFEWEKAEDYYLTTDSLKDFQSSVYPLVKDRFKPLSESTYHQLQRLAKIHTGIPASKNAPAVEALKIARITEVWFKNKIGCSFEERDSKIMTRTDEGEIHSVADTVKLWNPLYRADAIYLIDSDRESYSDGTPAKLYISVQIKSGESNFSGSGTAQGRVLENLQSYGKKVNKKTRETFKNPDLEAKPTQEEVRTVSTVFRGLCRGGYIVTRESWKNWFWLPDDYVHEPLRKGDYDDSDGKDYYIRLKYAEHYWKLRVAKPDKSKRLIQAIKLEPDFTKEK